MFLEARNWLSTVTQHSHKNTNPHPSVCALAAHRTQASHPLLPPRGEKGPLKPEARVQAADLSTRRTSGHTDSHIQHLVGYRELSGKSLGSGPSPT